MNHPDLLIYQELLQSLQDTYYTSIVRYDDDGRRPFLDINKNLFQNPLIHTLAVQIGINPIILASLISHLQGVGFLKGAKVVVPSSVTLENKIFLQHQTTLVKNSNEIAFDPETIINLHRYIHKFACIPCIQRLCGQDFEYILSTKPHGFFGTNSLYDWHYATYTSIWDYMEFLCCNYEQCNFILGTQRAVDTLLNIDTWTPDGYQDTIYDMTPPLGSNIQPIGDIILGDNTYGLNLIVHNTYLPYGLSFSLGLDLYDTQGILHRDTKLYMVNVVFEPGAELNTVVINTIQQSCRHVYYRIECNQIQLYYNTSHLANANETSVNHDDYVKPFLHKAVMDFFVDKHGSKLLRQLIGDKIHKSVITGDISSKIANQANYMHKLIEKHYHEYMRRSYDPTILLTAFISYIFSYHYRVCIIAPGENLRSMYHINDFDVGKKRSEKIIVSKVKHWGEHGYQMEDMSYLDQQFLVYYPIDAMDLVYMRLIGGHMHETSFFNDLSWTLMFVYSNILTNTRWTWCIVLRPTNQVLTDSYTISLTRQKMMSTMVMGLCFFVFLL